MDHTKFQVILYVPNVKKESDFYKSLGFEPKQKRIEDPSFIELKKNNITLSLHEKRDFNVNDVAGKFVMEIGTKDIHKTFQGCISQCVEVLNEPVEHRHGEVKMKVKSPSGYIIDFIQD